MFLEHLAIFLSMAWNVTILGYLIFNAVNDSSGEDPVITALIAETESLKNRIKRLETFQDPSLYNELQEPREWADVEQGTIK